jgi:hypothetical protein
MSILPVKEIRSSKKTYRQTRFYFLVPHALRGNADCVALAARDAEHPYRHSNGDRWNEEKIVLFWFKSLFAK